MVKEEEIKQIALKIAQEYNPEKIILFGSFAWGKPNDNSDVDLLIVKNTENVHNLAMNIDGFLFPRSFPIDLIVYTPEQIKKEIDLEEPFILKATKQGKILFTSNDRRK